MKSLIKKIIVWILTLEARLVVAKYKPKIIGITGSVGKTSTKDAIYTVLASSFFVRKSEKSFNSELGVPLTILGCDTAWNNPFLWLKNILKGLGVLILPNHYPSWLVLEIGLDAPGDIRRVVRWLSLDIAVFTKLSKNPVHVEFFNSVAELHEEKKALVRGLKRHGVLVVNNDDELLKEVKHPHGGRRLAYGIESKADVRASNVVIVEENDTPWGVNFKIEYQGNAVPVTIPGVLGRQHVYPALAAATVGISQYINLVAAGQALGEHTPAPGRMRTLRGIHDTLIIDDSYNSSPTALREALNVLQEIVVSGQKVVILGDMMELGKLSVDAHREAGTQVAGVADVLVTVGPRARYIAEGARGAGMPESQITEVGVADEAGERVKTMLKKGDIVLIKGSQAVRTEKAVVELMAEPERAPELLVRQDPVWLKKPVKVKSL